MYKNKKIGVVVPAYNEEKFIAKVIGRVPEYIDRIYVIDDASKDDTRECVTKIASNCPERVCVFRHEQNGGVGKAITTGYKGCLKDNIDIAVVMAGDNQMDPTQLPRLLDPIVDGKADYTVGDRLSSMKRQKGMSYWRWLGNWVLRWLTRIAAWNFSISDPQNGFTAITRQALLHLNLNDIYPRYGYCNDILVKLSSARARIKQIPILAVYGCEKSKIRYTSYIPKVSWLLLKDFLWRLNEYFLRRPILQRDFTLSKYEELCREMLTSGYEICTVASYLSGGNLGGKTVVLRHDVDSKVKKALRTAKLEHQIGINTTYYFRMTRGVFQPHLIKAIANMGHEVGYHYEVLDKAKGDYAKSIRIFEQELMEFRKVAEIGTICMHGNASVKWDNSDLWSKYDFRDFGLIGEAYLSFNGASVTYLSDTGRTWGKHKFKDWRPSANDKKNGGDIVVSSTDDVIDLVKKGQIGSIYILMHPERWSNNLISWITDLMVDIRANLVKRILDLLKVK